MKPLLLEIQAFGPFVDKQIIDFEKLSSKGIFLIKGKTGSGKTTIFDAMTFALYGGGSGTDDKSKVGRNDFKEWRCNQAPDNLETIISLVFSSRGKKYKFTRKLVHKKVNFSEEYEAGEIDENGNVIPFFNNPKKENLKDKAIEIIGLTKDQFRQVVLLPQGQFEKFLTASSKDKTEILNKIFSAEMWENYAQKFYDKVKGYKDDLDNKKKEVDISLQEENIETVEELDQKIKGLDKEIENLEKAHKEFKGDEKQKKLQDDIKLFEQFKSLHTLEKEKQYLINKKNEIDEIKATYDKAEKAEKIRPFINKFEEAEKELIRRSKELEVKENLKPEKDTALKLATSEKNKHDENSPVEKYNKKIGEYESKRETYESFGSVQEELNNAQEKYDISKKVYNDANQTFEELKDRARELFKISESAEAVAKEYRQKYYDGIYGEIASKLEENKKCPVCGSTSHPEPAQKAPNSVSKSDMETKEKAAETAKGNWQEIENQRETVEKEKNSKADTLKENETSLNVAKSKLENAQKSLIEGVANIDELNRAIGELKKKIEAYNNEGEKLQEAKEKAKKGFDELKANIETAKKEKSKAQDSKDEAEQELNKALAENEYLDVESVKTLLCDAEERKKLHEDITTYKTKCEQNKNDLIDKKNELSGKIEPDESKFEDRQNEINAESKNYNSNKTNFTNEKDRLQGKYDKLSPKISDYNAHITQADDDLKFAKSLRGDTGIGIQRYVLAIMFNQVIGEANEMLKKIHGGRYTLFRSDDKGQGNKRGLELKVHDNRSPENKEGRNVSMLSGGEKFLVSLALSIGMSTVAQKSGVQIEALFIDEGFGTLDGNSISDAMDVLESVRQSSSMIGIISHVELLEENIPTQIEVVKAKSGNSIKTV